MVDSGSAYRCVDCAPESVSGLAPWRKDMGTASTIALCVALPLGNIVFFIASRWEPALAARMPFVQLLLSLGFGACIGAPLSDAIGAERWPCWAQIMLGYLMFAFVPSGFRLRFLTTWQQHRRQEKLQMLLSDSFSNRDNKDKDTRQNSSIFRKLTALLINRFDGLNYQSRTVQLGLFLAFSAPSLLALAIRLIVSGCHHDGRTLGSSNCDFDLIDLCLFAGFVGFHVSHLLYVGLKLIVRKDSYYIREEYIVSRLDTIARNGNLSQTIETHLHFDNCFLLYLMLAGLDRLHDSGAVRFLAGKAEQSLGDKLSEQRLFLVRHGTDLFAAGPVGPNYRVRCYTLPKTPRTGPNRAR